MKNCLHCNKEYSDRGIRYHERYCKDNPNKSIPPKKTDKWKQSMKDKAENGTARNNWTKARENGEEYIMSDETRQKLREVNLGKKLTDEHKKKISVSRTAYLKENPDKVPYVLNHYSKGKSYPEKYWKEILDNNNIQYEEEYRISLYSLDFAIVDKKIDLEIDGDQHYLDKRIVESDKRRTKYLEENGWTVIRVKWSDYQKLNLEERVMYVNNLIEMI